MEDQQLVFQDGTEIPDKFYLAMYTEENDIKYQSRIKACERLYLLDASEGKGICANIYKKAVFSDYNTIILPKLFHYEETLYYYFCGFFKKNH